MGELQFRAKVSPDKSCCGCNLMMMMSTNREDGDIMHYHHERPISAFGSPMSTVRRNRPESVLTSLSHKSRDYLPSGRITPKNAKTNHFIMSSGIYAKLLVVTGTAFILAEVITQRIDMFYYEIYFSYLFGGSILFLMYVYVYLLRGFKAEPKRENVMPRTEDDSGDTLSRYSTTNRRIKTSDNHTSHGSFFLRVGAVAFGLGTIIYNGLELGAYFETPVDSPCYSVLQAVNPVLQMVFTFMQMYFIFRNARLNIHKFKVVARFGLMHVVATNLCIWIKVLVHESIEEISEMNVLTNDQPVYDELIRQENIYFKIVNGTLNYTNRCKHIRIMGDIEESSEPYIYPFIIEYSLIGASVLYVMWKHIGRRPDYVSLSVGDRAAAVELAEIASTQSSANIKVDCVGTSKGLFAGLFVLVAIAINIILFFVLIGHPDYGFVAEYLGDLSHCIVLVLSSFACIVGFIRVRSLHFKTDKDEELSDLLLGVSSFGLYMYSVLGLISSCRLSFDQQELFTLAVSGLTVIQITLQSLFMADMSRRTLACSLLSIDAKQKPGRQIVTFMLICNLTLWIIYTFQTQSVLSTPTQVQYFGHLPWAVIIRICQPLAIFYRFHSAVTFAEIWKNAYKTSSVE